MSDQASGGSNPAAGAPKPAPANPAPKEGQKPPQKAQESAEAPKEKPQQFIDLDGEQVDLEEIKQNRKKWKGVDNKFREIAEEKKAALKARKEVEDFLGALQEDPSLIFEDPRFAGKKQEVIARLLREKIERDLQEDPDESEDKKKLRQYEEKEQQEKQAQENAKRQQVIEHRQQHLGKLFNEAIEASPLAKDPKLKDAVIGEMARYALLCRREYGYTPDPQELAQHVADQRMTGFKLAASTQDEDSLLDFFGDEIADRIMQAKLKRLRASRSTPPPQTAETWQSRQEKPKREFFDPNELARQARRKV